MGGSGWVWRVWNFMTQNPTRPTIKKKFVTQLNPPSLKNRPNLIGRVGFGGLAAHPYYELQFPTHGL